MSEPVDPERPHVSRPFDRPTGYSGQDYTAGQEIALRAQQADPAFRDREDDRDLPPDAGQRAAPDPTTGEVHGSGAGAGGGNPGEDFDTSNASGDSYPLTGSEDDPRRSPDPGPPRLTE